MPDNGKVLSHTAEMFKTRTRPNTDFSVLFQTPLASVQLESFKGRKKKTELSLSFLKNLFDVTQRQLNLGQGVPSWARRNSARELKAPPAKIYHGKSFWGLRGPALVHILEVPQE